MPREARKRSQTGIYHVMSRGINKTDIFLDDEDRLRYLYQLRHLQTEYGLLVHAYCLMSNHVHLLISEGKEPIGESMRRIGVAYASWFNAKHGRVGHVFQGRFGSEVVETNEYFLTVLRYILQNPVQAGLCQAIDEFPWSSHYEYTGGRGRVPHLVTTELASSIMGSPKKLLQYLREAPGSHNQTTSILDVVDTQRMSDREVRSYLGEILPAWNPNEPLSLERTERRRILKLLKEMPGASVHQIARITGLSKGIVERA